MPEMNPVLPVLPVTPSAALPGNNANAATSQPDEGQAAFAQVLRDRQQANSEAANAGKSIAKPAEKPPTEKPAPANNSASEAPATTGNEAADAPPTEGTTRTPAELAQLLAAAGLIANTHITANTTAPRDTSDQTAPLTDLTSETNADVTGNPNALTAEPQSDTTAALATNIAASLAANTAAAASTAASSNETLSSQSPLTGLDAKSQQAGHNAAGQHNGAEKQTPLAIAAEASAGKSRADTAAPDASFAAALDRAGQAAEATHSGVQTSTNVSATQTTQNTATPQTISTPVGRSGWADEVGQRVLWTAKSDSSRADLILTPAQLGRIEVSIQINGDQATASFVAANPIAREALQDAMPRLRELMAQAGIDLGQADVSAGQSGQNSAQGQRRPSGNGGGMLGTEGILGTTNSGGWTGQGNGIVDTFA